MYSLMKSWILLASFVAGSAAFAIPTTAISEEVQLGEIKASISIDCRISFTNKEGRKAQWVFPTGGTCYFSKNHRDGKVKIYQHSIRNRPPSKAQLIIAHSSRKLPSGECEGMHVAIVVNGPRVLIGTPPYPAYAACGGPTLSLDEKHFSVAWFEILEHGKYEEVVFPAN